MSSTIENLSKALADYNQEVQKLKKALSEKTEGEIKTISLEIFNAYPDLAAFGWSQYTPYFNDGDACIFRVNEVQFTDDEEVVDSPNDWEYGFYGKYENKFPMLQEFADCLCSADDILLDLFGDHAFIRITRDGLEVEEYEHD